MVTHIKYTAIIKVRVRSNIYISAHTALVSKNAIMLAKTLPR